jgi:hypothetical protein
MDDRRNSGEPNYNYRVHEVKAMSKFIIIITSIIVLYFHTLCTRRLHLDVLFLVSGCHGFKCCPSLLETVGPRVPTRNLRDFR